MALRPKTDEKSNLIIGTTFLHIEKRVSIYGAAAPYMVNARCRETHVQAARSRTHARTHTRLFMTFNTRFQPRSELVSTDFGG